MGWGLTEKEKEHWRKVFILGIWYMGLRILVLSWQFGKVVGDERRLEDAGMRDGSDCHRGGDRQRGLGRAP